MKMRAAVAGAGLMGFWHAQNIARAGGHVLMPPPSTSEISSMRSPQIERQPGLRATIAKPWS